MLNKKYFKALIFNYLCIIHLFGNAQTNINLDFPNNINTSTGWNLGIMKEDTSSYFMTLDSINKISKNASLTIINKSHTDKNQFGSAYYSIYKKFEGSNITLTGYLKTKDITSGFAGLFLALMNGSTTLHYENLKNLNLKGSTDWKKFSITFPYSKEITKITFGALLAGNGQLWMDSISLKIDEKEITVLNTSQLGKEEEIIESSNNIVFKIDEHKALIPVISLLGEVWSFIKYHHEGVAIGKYDMDNELLMVLIKVINAKTNKDALNVINKWIKLFEIPSDCSTCSEVWKDRKNTNRKMNLYGKLFDSSMLSNESTRVLEKILNHSSIASHFYVNLNTNVGNPKFTNEYTYEITPFPNPLIRLIGLFRYWASIQYFYPYRNLLEKKWFDVLSEFIPIFLNAQNELEYTIACMKLFGTINDAHAWINGLNRTREKYLGINNAPIKVIFINDTLVINQVIPNLQGTENNSSSPKRGDIITHINSVPIDSLLKKLLPIVPGANYSGKLREVAEIILRGNSKILELNILRENTSMKLIIERLEQNEINFPPTGIATDILGTSIINDSIGYLYAGNFYSKNLENIKTKLHKTSGLIIDLRCYPSDFMPFTIGNYIKSSYSSFVSYTTTSLNHLGYFENKGLINNGNGIGDKYKNKVIVLVNEYTQSSAEYTVMALQSAENVTVIGSTTAGTDGNMSKIMLPGGIETNFSGIGIFYPDKSPTQQVGVKIDMIIRPTIKGIINGIDEILSMAIKILEKKN